MRLRDFYSNKAKLLEVIYDSGSSSVFIGVSPSLDVFWCAWLLESGDEGLVMGRKIFTSIFGFTQYSTPSSGFLRSKPA